MPLHVSNTCAHHQEVKIALHSLWYHHTYRSDDTRGCVMQFWPPDDEHMCSKHVEAWNKLIVKQKFCASSLLITEINILRCTVSKTSKKSFILYIATNSNIVVFMTVCIYRHTHTTALHYVEDYYWDKAREKSASCWFLLRKFKYKSRTLPLQKAVSVHRITHMQQKSSTDWHTVCTAGETHVLLVATQVMGKETLPSGHKRLS